MSYRGRASQNTVNLIGALAQGNLPPHIHSHTPIKGFQCTASEDDHRAERGRIKKIGGKRWEIIRSHKGEGSE